MSSESRYVPKVHPLSRPGEVDDPLELRANPVEGDPEIMLQAIVEEFAWLGFSTDELLGLFGNPDYPVLLQLAAHFGRDEVRRRIEERLGDIGLVRFTEVLADDPLAEEAEEPALIQLSVDKVVPRNS